MSGIRNIVNDRREGYDKHRERRVRNWTTFYEIIGDGLDKNGYDMEYNSLVIDSVIREQTRQSAKIAESGRKYRASGQS
jgi:hypothetical protein